MSIRCSFQRSVLPSFPAHPLSRCLARRLKTAQPLRFLALGLALTMSLAAFAENDASDDNPEAKQLGIELNRLEQTNGACRVYLVFTNQLKTGLNTLQLELVLFDTDGYVQRRLTLDAAPIADDKTSVKLFDLTETKCERVGRILINDVLAIAGADGALPSDVSQLDLSSKLDVDLFK